MQQNSIDPTWGTVALIASGGKEGAKPVQVFPCLTLTTGSSPAVIARATVA